MRVFEGVAHALESLGVETVFGLMGDGNMRLLTYWSADLGHGYVGTRHEAAAVAAADGYARVSGELGVCTVTQGPGLTNALTALVTARKARTPLLFLVGDVAAHQQGWPQDIDHAAVFGAMQVPLVSLTDRASVFTDVVRAATLALETRGPVGINLPTDFQEQEWNSWDDDLEAALVTAPVPVADAGEVARVADLLASARKPVILGGRGAVERECAPALVEIGDRVGAVLATTLRGKGLFGGHPFGVGVVGGLGSNVAVQVLGEADVVLVVGAALNDFTLMRGSLLHPECRVVVCDIDGSHRMAGDERATFVHADAAEFSRALLAELERRDVRQEGFRTRVGERLAEYDPRAEFSPVEDPGHLDPRIAALVVDEHAPEDRVVVTDAGHFFGNAVTYLEVPDGRSFVCGIDFGSIGLGLGHAIGAAVARPERQIVLVVGDGGLIMSSGDLETLARYGLRVLVVAMNDAAYGSELQILRLWELDETLSTFPDPDLATVAGSWGIESHTATTVDELAAALQKAPQDAPLLVDCKISSRLCASWLEEAFRH